MRQTETEQTTRELPGSTGPLASFVRFVACGGGIGVLSGGAVALLAALLPWAVANAVVTVVSTVVATELHARFTFGAGRRAGRREHVQAAGSAAAAYGVTCAAMAVLHLVHAAPGVLLEQAVYLSAAAAAGVGRFVVLRVFVFGAKGSAGSAGSAGNRPAVLPAPPRPDRPRARRPRSTAPSWSYTWQEWVCPDAMPVAYGRWTTAGAWSPAPA